MAAKKGLKTLGNEPALSGVKAYAASVNLRCDLPFLFRLCE